MNKRIGKYDLLVLCLLAAGILLAVLLQTPRKNQEAGGYAVITVGDREYARTPLNEYSVIPILDEEASITFWLCAPRKNKKLLDSIPPIV